MFQTIGDLVSLKWLREHPIVTSTSKLAGVVLVAVPQIWTECNLSMIGEVYKNGFGVLIPHDTSCDGLYSDTTSELKQGRSHKALSDISTPEYNDSSDESLNAEFNSCCSNELHQDSPSDFDFMRPIKSTKSFDGNAFDDHTGENLSDVSPGSPHWGWFVSFTPPEQRFYSCKASYSR